MLWFDELPFSHMQLRALRRERTDWMNRAHNPRSAPQEVNLAAAYIAALTEWIERRRAYLAKPWRRAHGWRR